MHPSRIIRPLFFSALLIAAVDARAQTLGPCAPPDLPPDARCTTVEVPENRDRPEGRRIALHVVVLPARTPGAERQGMTFFGGGPGQASATHLVGGIAAEFAALRDTRDLLFVDQRGTGRSAPLPCNLRDESNPQTYLDEYLPPGPVAACRDSLVRIADLTRYGSAEMAHDMEAVRRALGYGPLDLWGGSYGTRAALVYLRMYPASVRSALLQGLVPPRFAQPADYARDFDDALAGLLAECHAEPACGAAFPDVAAEVRAVAARLDSVPGEGEIVDEQTGRRLTLRLERGMFAETVRRMMYAPELAGMVPFVIHRAYRGDYRPVLRQALADRRAFGAGIWQGLFITLVCNEDIPRIDRARAARDAEGTVLGDYRLRQQTAACAGWPRYTPPADAAQPVRSDAPVLLISGALDPVTPPRWGDTVAATLPNALHVVVPHGGHAYDGLIGDACVDSLAVRFVRAGSARGLDTSCLGQIRRPPFVVDAPEAVAVDAEALRRLAGRYASEELGVRVEALDGALRVQGDDVTLIASPLSPTRFFWEGRPGYELEFAADGSVLTVRAPDRTFVLTRRP